MIEPWLFGIILITVVLVGLALFVDSQPTVPTREERERSEILAILRRIEATLMRESSESTGKATQLAPTQNSKDRHEENPP